MITSKQAAQIFGVTIRRIDQHVKDGTLIRPKPGFVSCESLAALLKKERDEKTDDIANYEADKARKMAADADLSEIQAGKAAGELVLARPMRKAIEDAIAVAVIKLIAVGPKVAPLVILERHPKPAGEIITNAIRAACEELHHIDIRESSAIEEPAATE